jgi:hypothetical protein
MANAKVEGPGCEAFGSLSNLLLGWWQMRELMSYSYCCDFCLKYDSFYEAIRVLGKQLSWPDKERLK